MSRDEDELREEFGTDVEVAELLVLNAAGIAGALGIRCPMCPACGGPPEPSLSAITWPGQAMCSNDACEAIMWSPMVSAREQLAQAQTVDLETRPARRADAPRPARDDDHGAAAGQ